jgi:hypothetical protein
MCDRRVRVLVLAEETALADVIYRGLTAVPNLETEIEVVLDESTVQGLLQLRRYDLLVVGSCNGTDPSALAESLGAGIPVVAVGGSPRDARALRGGVARVPLPFSYRLLALAVRGALDGKAPEDEEFHRRRDSVG